MPVSPRINVVLPLPFVPMSASISPSFTLREIPLTVGS